MSNNIQNDWRQQIIFCSMVFMMISLFLPRSILSISLAVFIIISFLHKNLLQQFRYFFSSSLLLGITLLFLVPFVSGIWSQDKEEWMDVLRIKLPLLLMPIAFASPFNLSKKNWERLANIFILVVTIGTLWSISQYFMDMNSIHEGYLKSKMIRTPLDDDHIRFSWIVSIAIVLAGWIFVLNREKFSRVYFSFLLIVAIWLIIYLHILAARTGILCLYAVLLFLAGWYLFKRSKLSAGIGITILFITLPIASWFLFPTFQNRIKYILYDASYLTKSIYLPGSNDGRRFFSIKAGLNIVSDNPIIGVGFGDIRNEMNEWYGVNVPQMLEKDRLYPSSEWLIYGMGCGIFGVIIFSAVMLLPFFLPNHRKQIPWLLLNITVILTLLFDIGLEVQYGVFLYSFIVLWWWKWLQSQKTI
jgi:O-antigen ligase